MKGAQVQTVVRVPMSAVVKELAATHSIRLPLSCFALEGDSLVITFGSVFDDHTEESTGSLEASPAIRRADKATLDVPKDRVETSLSASRSRAKRGRRRSGSRNRMKTRGWNVVAKIQNSHGQTVAVYEPFVTALKGPKQPRRAMERIVEHILRSNGNDPKRSSIEYFLNNTLEFISSGSSEQTLVEGKGSEG